MFAKAKAFMEERTISVDSYEEFKAQITVGGGQGGRSLSRFILAHWCGSAECEAKVKEDTAATIRNIPIDGPTEVGKCLLCGKTSERRVIFGKSY